MLRRHVAVVDKRHFSDNHQRSVHDDRLVRVYDFGLVDHCHVTVDNHGLHRLHNDWNNSLDHDGTIDHRDVSDVHHRNQSNVHVRLDGYHVPRVDNDRLVRVDDHSDDNQSGQHHHGIDAVDNYTIVTVFNNR